MRLITCALSFAGASAFVAPHVPVSRTLRRCEAIAMVEPMDPGSRITGRAQPSSNDWKFGTGAPRESTSGGNTRADGDLDSRTFATGAEAGNDWRFGAGGLPGQQQPRSALLRVRVDGWPNGAQYARQSAQRSAAAARA